MKLDDFVAGCWLTCDDWYFNFRCDKMWVLVATCSHHRFETGCSVFKIENALAVMYDRIMKWHEENGND